MHAEGDGGGAERGETIDEERKGVRPSEPVGLVEMRKRRRERERERRVGE